MSSQPPTNLRTDATRLWDRVNVGRKLLLGLLLVAAVFGASPVVAQSPTILSGPDLGKYFDLVVLPEYPYDARKHNFSGVGTFRAFAGANGKVSRVEVVKGTGHKELDDAVVTAARRWRAKPGKKREIDFPIQFVAPYFAIPPIKG